MENLGKETEKIKEWEKDQIRAVEEEYAEKQDTLRQQQEDRHAQTILPQTHLKLLQQMEKARRGDEEPMEQTKENMQKKRKREKDPPADDRPEEDKGETAIEEEEDGRTGKGEVGCVEQKKEGDHGEENETHDVDKEDEDANEGGEGEDGEDGKEKEDGAVGKIDDGWGANTEEREEGEKDEERQREEEEGKEELQDDEVNGDGRIGEGKGDEEEKGGQEEDTPLKTGTREDLEDGEAPEGEEVAKGETVTPTGMLLAIQTEHTQAQKEINDAENERMEEIFSHQKRRTLKSTDSDETEVIKNKTAEGKEELILGNFKYFIKPKMKEDMERRISRKGLISEEELFIFYALRAFERYPPLDTMMDKAKWEASMAYLLQKYAGPVTEAAAQIRRDRVKISARVWDRWVSRTDTERRATHDDLGNMIQ